MGNPAFVMEKHNVPNQLPARWSSSVYASIWKISNYSAIVKDLDHEFGWTLENSKSLRTRLLSSTF